MRIRTKAEIRALRIVDSDECSILAKAVANLCEIRALRIVDSDESFLELLGSIIIEFQLTEYRIRLVPELLQRNGLQPGNIGNTPRSIATACIGTLKGFSDRTVKQKGLLRWLEQVDEL